MSWCDMVIRKIITCIPNQAGLSQLKGTDALGNGREGEPTCTSTSRHTDNLQLRWVPVLLHNCFQTRTHARNCPDILRTARKSARGQGGGDLGIHIPFSLLQLLQPYPSSRPLLLLRRRAFFCLFFALCRRAQLTLLSTHFYWHRGYASCVPFLIL